MQGFKLFWVALSIDGGILSIFFFPPNTPVICMKNQQMPCTASMYLTREHGLVVVSSLSTVFGDWSNWEPEVCLLTDWF
jgi:hypothetical protein